METKDILLRAEHYNSIGDFLEHYRTEDPVVMQDYSRLFFGTGDAVLPLWESAAADNRGILLNRRTLAVKQYMEKEGFAVKREDGQLADSIGNEFRFMAYLLESEKAETAGKFLEGHLLPFWKLLFEKLKKEAATDVMQEALEKIDVFLEQEALRLLGKPGSDCRKFADPSVEDTDRRIVSTVGRGNCGGRCIVKSHVADGCVLYLSTDEEEGEAVTLKACARGRTYRSTFLSDRRLRYPMKRIGERGEGKFTRISWEEAIATIASETRRIRDTYGPGARYVNYSSGVNAMMRGDLMAKRLLALDGGYLDWYNTYSAACTEIATPYTYGTGQTGSSAVTYDASKLIVVWGFNPVETFFNAEFLQALQRAKKRGCEIIVVDPRYSDTAAAFATQWIPLRPTTDSALIDGMAYVIVTENLQDQEFLDRFCIGFDEVHMPEGAEKEDCYLDYLLGKKDGVAKTPEWASRITGVPVETIVQFARKYATVKPAALIPGLGHQRQGNGEQAVRSTTLLPCLTGNVGVYGGHAGGGAYCGNHRMPQFPVGHNPYPGSIPSFLWTAAVAWDRPLTAGEDGVRGMEELKSPIKLIYNLAGNTLINQHSDCNATASLLKDTGKCEFIVCSDVFLTPSARYADILLPAASMFETYNINTPWREGNYLLASSPAIDPVFECRFEYDWLKEVAGKLGLWEAFTEGKDTVLDWMREKYEEVRSTEKQLPAFETFLAKGGHKYTDNIPYVAFRQQIEEPEKYPFPTPSGKIEIYSERLKQSGRIPPIPCYTPSFEGPQSPEKERYPIQLIGFHNKTHCHSVHDNNPVMEIVEPHRVWIHKVDAMSREIKDGDEVLIYNDRGRIRMKAYVTERIFQGVAAMPQGGYRSLNAAGEDIRGDINTITTLQPTPLARGNPQHSNLVQIQKAGEANEAGT